MSEKTLTYEQAQQELEEILHALQQQAVSIDELSEKSKRALALITFCKEKLRKVELDLNTAFDAQAEF